MNGVSTIKVVLDLNIGSIYNPFTETLTIPSNLQDFVGVYFLNTGLSYPQNNILKNYLL